MTGIALAVASRRQTLIYSSPPVLASFGLYNKIQLVYLTSSLENDFQIINLVVNI